MVKTRTYHNKDSPKYREQNIQINYSIKFTRKIIMKKFSILTIALIITLIGVFVVGCATIATGTTQLVTINSNVEGASIYLDGVDIGKTPFTGEIKKNGKILKIEKDGYKPYSISLSTNLEGAFWGNIITGGTLGSITDFASGAAYAYAPSSFQIEMISKDDVGLIEFKKVYELKKFAMVNMSNIAIDLSNNSGGYLQSLIHLVNLDKNSNAVEIIKSNLLKSNGDQVAFGTLMVSLLEG